MIRDQRRIRCEEHLPELLLFDSDGVMRILARRGFSSLPDLTPGQRTRLPETLLAWLTTGGSVPETAARLMIHPQTVRYRMRQLEEIFGDQLHDHDWRFEMQLVLRAELLVKSETRPAPR
jgi:DNA-binding PucR family transcriptional regulator